MLAGGVESMSRAPLVMPKVQAVFSRSAEIHDTTIGWRFVNPAMKAAHGTNSMPQTADNVAAEWGISRDDQDAFALRSQARCAAAEVAGVFAEEIVPVEIPQHRRPPLVVDRDEHPRPGTTAETLAALKGINGPELGVTAGNSSGMTATPVSARQAEAWGMIWQVVAAEDLMAAAETMTRDLAQAPAPALGRIKQALLAAERHGLTEHLALEARLQGERGRCADYAEGLRAFLSRRAPVFNAKP